MDGFKRMLTVHLINGSTLNVFCRSCKKLVEEADTDCLLQCSRSAIVNKNYVESIDIPNQYITMKGIPAKVEIGVTYRKKIIAEYEL